MSNESQATILVLLPDLMFGERVSNHIRQLGYHGVLVDSAQEAQAALRADLALLIVDLRTDMPGWQALIEAAQALDPTLPILAFGSHIAGDRFRAARHAGAQEVVANSKFSETMAHLILKNARPT